MLTTQKQQLRDQGIEIVEAPEVKKTSKNNKLDVLASNNYGVLR